MENPLEKHLFYPRNIDGEKNIEYLNTLRAINDLLISHDSYIGICPSGSHIKGYANESSDFDYVILGGKTLEDEEEEIQELVSKTFEKRNKIHIIILRIDAIDQTPFCFSFEAALLARPIIGKIDEIEKYRRSVKDRFSQLGKKDKKDFIFSAAQDAMYRYDMHHNDQSDRLDLNVEEKDELVEKRRSLWEKRIKNFLG